MPPAKQRPTPVTVIAYLNIIFGSLWVVLFLCGSVGIFVGYSWLYGPPMANEPKEFAFMKGMYRMMIESMGRHIPYFYVAFIAEQVFALLMALLILVAGIGLFRMRPWARTACIVYGVLAILEKIAGLVYNITLVNPNQAKATEEWMNWIKNNQPPNANMGAAFGGAAGGNPLLENMTSVFGSFCGMIYPIVVLILMLLPSVAAAFKRGPDEPPMTGPAADDEYMGYERPYGKDDF